MDNAALRALIMAAAPGLEGRIYPLVMPEELADAPSLRPSAVYQTTAVDRGRTFCGDSGATSTSVALDIYSTDYDALDLVATQVCSALDNYRGGSFLLVVVQSETDVVEPDPGLYRRAIDLTIWHTGA
jgi:hypothetical protein